MSQATYTAPSAPAGMPRRPSLLSKLWHRQLPHYPDNGPRTVQLGIVVLATVVLYYELYIGGAVSTQIIAYYDVTLRYLIMLSVIGNAVGALASLAAGLADRWGRANLVTYGLAITGALVAFGLPRAHSATVYFALFGLVSLVEGVILVATPALVRDFSPQLGRAAAMGFWTLGPVLGSLVVTEVSSHTLASHPRWQFQFELCGAIGLIVFVIALFGLRELAPQLRDQLMVSAADRALIEARAAGIDPDKAVEGAWRQLVRPRIIGSAFAVSVFLLFYYIAVGFFVIYFATNYGYSLARANGLANWYWISNAIALVITGALSDRLRVRKPLMLVGALISAAGVAVFAQLATSPSTGYYTLAWVLVAISAGGGLAYCAWMAAFTETVEHYNPAGTATGLAIWGSMVRVVVTLSLVGFIFAVSSADVLVNEGPKTQALATRYAAQLDTAAAVDPATLATLAANPADAKAGIAAVGQLTAKRGVTPTEAIARLQALGAVPKADLTYLQEHGPTVQRAAARSPKQWRVWWYVCFAGQLVFLPFIFVLVGRWSPRRARADAVAHEQALAREMAARGL